MVRDIWAIMECMAYCDRCDMERAYCEHGLAERRQAASSSAISLLLISPRGIAHFPGCPHKGDDPDYDNWAELNAPGAWTRLGNGEHMHATGGPALTSSLGRGARTVLIRALGSQWSRWH